MASSQPIWYARPHGGRDKVPEPLLSSRSRKWTGITVEHYRVRDVDIVSLAEEHLVVVFLRGQADLYQQRNGRALQRIMRPGDVIVAPVGEPRTLRHKEEIELVKLRLSPSFAAKAIDEIVPRAGSVELLDNFGTRDALVEQFAHRFVAELRADAWGERVYAESMATELVVHLLRHYSTQSKMVDDSSHMLPSHKLRRVIDYINEHLRDELTLEEMAQTLSMSVYHFAHAFRETVGSAPHHYVVKCRIDQAKTLLRGTDLPITEVGRQVGYTNASTFSIAFHKLTGQTPRGYRNQA